MKLIDKLSCMTASRNALQDEISGLHQYINKLHERLNIKERFTTKPPNTQMQTSQKACCLLCAAMDKTNPNDSHCGKCGRPFDR